MLCLCILFSLFFSITDFLNRELKKTVIKTVMWNVTLYGLETWTLREMDVKLLEAFEIWTWRQMEDTSWRDEREMKKCGESRRKIEPGLVISKRNRAWIGYLLRRKELLKMTVEGRPYNREKR